MSDHKTKLAPLVENERYETFHRMLEEIVVDSVSPGICMNEGCDFICEVEPDKTPAGARAPIRRSVLSF